MKVVNKLPVGVVGEIADSSLKRVLMKQVGTGAVEIGLALTADTNGVVSKGGTGAFAGIAVSPKQYSKDGLGTTMTIPANGSVEALSFGRVWVKVASAVTIGAQASFSQSAGTISAATGSGNTAIANSKFLTAATGGTGDEVALLELS